MEKGKGWANLAIPSSIKGKTGEGIAQKRIHIFDVCLTEGTGDCSQGGKTFP